MNYCMPYWERGRRLEEEVAALQKQLAEAKSELAEAKLNHPRHCVTLGADKWGNLYITKSLFDIYDNAYDNTQRCIQDDYICILEFDVNSRGYLFLNGYPIRATDKMRACKDKKNGEPSDEFLDLGVDASGYVYLNGEPGKKDRLELEVGNLGFTFITENPTVQPGLYQ